MAANTREIRRRIRSVKNIGQITKAMELVSAAKMRRAQGQALASRPYSQISSQLLKNLVSKIGAIDHPLAGHPQDGNFKKLIILVTSDRGLAGALNTNVINAAVKLAKSEGQENVDFVTVGKKGADMIRRMKFNIVAAFGSKDRNISIFDAKSMAGIGISDFLSKKYDKVYIVYTNFISTLTQKANVIQLLPLASAPEDNADEEYLFEPSAPLILDRLINRTIEFTVYQTLVEAAASEHSARMVAMRNANQAASDLIDDLQLFYNQARQAGITKELAEISAAKLAMEQ